MALKSGQQLIQEKCTTILHLTLNGFQYLLTVVHSLLILDSEWSLLLDGTGHLQPVVHWLVLLFIVLRNFL